MKKNDLTLIKHLSRLCFGLSAIISMSVTWCLASSPGDVYMANGIKICDVNSDTAIIWTRLTKNPERIRSSHQFTMESKEGKKKVVKDHLNGSTLERAAFTGMDQIPPGLTLDEMDGAVPGAIGETRVTYWPEGNENLKKIMDWQAVDPHQNFTGVFYLKGLKPATHYQMIVEGRSSAKAEVSGKLTGKFTTAPTADQVKPVTLSVVTCSGYHTIDDKENGYLIYKAIREKINPDFFVHTGDLEYYDKPGPFALCEALARYKMNRLYSLPYARNLLNNVSSYFIKDDHDIVCNDASPGKNFGALTWEQGLLLFREQFPMGEKPYRTIRWGKDLQIWLIEGREYRSQNMDQDSPEKTIWGKKQKAWFYETVKKSDASFKLLITGDCIVGPDRENKNDNLSNEGFHYEGDEIRNFISTEKNMFVVTGDRHWQYYSVDKLTGVREFSCGAHSDKHANGFNEADQTPEQKFLRIKGGFLSVSISREGGQPKIIFRHHDVSGIVVHEEIFTDPFVG